jgi:hypothetical protein
MKALKANISSPIQTLLSVREFHPVGTMLLHNVRGLYRRYGISPSPKILLFYSMQRSDAPECIRSFINRIIKLV